MSAPLIPVVMTTYNYGRYIEGAIESVLSQDYPPDGREPVIVDDGSTADTAERVRKYGSKVRCFFKPNGGQASALNLGFANARGEIIALLDADDYRFPGKIWRIVEEFQKNPELGMVYDAFLDSGHFFGGKPEFFWYQPPGTSTAYRRKSLEPVLPIPEEIRKLADAYIDVLLPFYSPVLAIPEYLTAYRFHEKNNFHADELQMPRETRKGRLHKWEILIVARRRGLTDKGFTLEQPSVRSFLDCLTLRQDQDEFILQPPDRLRFFRHLLLYNRCYGLHLSRRLRFINYLDALGALATGYKHFHLLDQWRERASKPLRRLQRGET